MRKYRKIVFINVIIIIIFYLFLELLSILILSYNYRKELYGLVKNYHPKLVNIYFPKSLREQNPQKYEYYFRKPFIFDNNNQKSVLIYGCSFAYGYGLSNEESLGGVLAKLTKRNIYNRAIGGSGPQMMLYDIQMKKCINIVNGADYIIYIYMDAHINRILMFRCWPFLNKVLVKYVFDKKTGKLIPKKPNFYQTYSYIYRLIELYRTKHTSFENKEKLLYEIIKQSYIELNKLYPNSKFIILNYSVWPLPEQKQFEDIGIKVISVSDLTNKNLFSLEYYNSEYDNHPNKKVWEELTPILIKKLNM